VLILAGYPGFSFSVTPNLTVPGFRNVARIVDEVITCLHAIHVCKYIPVCVYICVYIYIYICRHAAHRIPGSPRVVNEVVEYIHAIYICMYMYVYVSIYVYVYMYMYMYIYKYK